MTGVQTLPAHAAYAPAGAAPLAWDSEAGSSVLQSDTAWLLSFIDILTLLLTLFVLLLAYDRNHQPVMELSLLAPQERVSESGAEPLPVMETLETRNLPDLPLLISGGFMGLDPLSPGVPDSIEGLIGSADLPAAETPAAIVADVAVPITALIPRAAEISAESPPVVSPVDAAEAAPTSSPLLDAEPSVMSLLPEPELPDVALSVKLPPGTQVLPAPVPEMPAEQRQETAAAQNLLQNLSSALRERVEVSVATGVVNMEISDNILFQPASAALAGVAYAVLDELAAALRDQPGVLSVEGHTDNVPIQTALFPSNWELSAARSAVVTRSFIARGVAPDRIRAIGYGDTRPRADNLSSEGRARNRRVSFVLHLE